MTDTTTPDVNLDATAEALRGPWRAVLTDGCGYVIDTLDGLDDADEVSISIRRGSALPDSDGSRLPAVYCSGDVIELWDYLYIKDGGPLTGALARWAQAQAMAGGLNAASEVDQVRAAPLPGAVHITQEERAELLAGALGLAQRARADAEAERDRLRAELEQARTAIVELVGLVDEPPVGSHLWDRDADEWERRTDGLWYLTGRDRIGWSWRRLRRWAPFTIDDPTAGQVTP